MRAGLRFGMAAIWAATWLALAAPALAQDNNAATAAPSRSPPPADTVGPRELQGFTLNGTVTREAEPQPTRPAARGTTPTTQPATTPPRPATAAPAPDRTATAEPRQAPPRESSAPARSATVSLPPVENVASTEPTDSTASTSSLGSQPGLAPLTLPQTANTPVDQGPSMLPWLLAALLLALGAIYYAWRQRSRAYYAGAGALERFIPAEPPPPPEPLQRAQVPAQPAAPPAAPPPPPPSPTGIVSTRLRPWLDLDFQPVRCVITDDQATIEFALSVLNSGSGPARDVLIEACMFNAGPAQDQEIARFFENPVAKGERMPQIPPLKKVTLKSAVTLPREQVLEFEVAGRKLFVPLIGFNTLYRWGAGEGQSSMSYLVGRDTNSDKMGPFRLDLGPRIFRGLAAREHHVRVRK